MPKTDHETDESGSLRSEQPRSHMDEQLEADWGERPDEIPGPVMKDTSDTEWHPETCGRAPLRAA